MVIVPGITVSTVVSTALARGMVAALWFELGAACARFTMVLVVAVALQTVTGLVSALFDIIKLIGAAYLAYLGAGYLVARGGLKLSDGREGLSTWRQMGAGFLMLWTNPKALLFFGAFIPQFVDPRYAAWPQVLVLGLIEIVAAAFADGGYILISVGARSILAGPALVWVNRIAGVILIAAAVWLATLGR